jgi:hypothetical protein
VRGEKGYAQLVVWVRPLLGRQVIGPLRQHLGHVQDVVALRPPGPAPTTVTGLIADLGGRETLIPVAAIREWQGSQVVVHALPLRRPCARRPDEFLVARCAIRKPVLTGGGALRRVGDVALRHTSAGWVVWAADTRTAVERLIGSPRRVVEWDVLARSRLA